MREDGKPPGAAARAPPAPGVSWHLEPAVVFGDGVGEVDALPLGQELPQLRPLLHAQVIAHEIPVDAVPPPLLEVVEDAGGWRDPEEVRVRRGSVLVALSPPRTSPGSWHTGHGRKWGSFYAMGGIPAP